MFTFIVTCYNQAEVIPYALESVRYQICKFGRGQPFQLILADDGSTDQSRAVMERWLAENGQIFERVDRLFREENGGICKNYVEALRLVAGERFAVLNGDDLFSPYDLFAVSDLLEEYDLVCNSFIKFTGSGNINRTYSTYLEVVLQEFIRGNTLRRCVKMGCPVMGPALFRREFLTEEVYDFILRFRTVNDRACFQKIVGGHKDLKVCYVNRPIILYRTSDHSISNFNSPYRALHNQEIAQLCRETRAGEKPGFFKAMLHWQEKSASFRASPHSFVRLMRFFAPYYFIMLGLFVKHFGKIVRLEHELVDSHWRQCGEYYKEIAKRADP